MGVCKRSATVINFANKMAATRGDDPAAAAAQDLATGGAAARRASADYRVSVFNRAAFTFEVYRVGALNVAAFTIDALPECRVGAHNAAFATTSTTGLSSSRPTPPREGEKSENPCFDSKNLSF